MSTSSARTRRNVYSLDPGGPELTSYANGISAMQGRDVSDPTSWAFWAAMHGTSTSPTTQLEQDLWNHCQHGCWFFLSWHRMYIYFFEEMIRAASGDLNFGLPYWNYSDGWPQWAALPPAFRSPPTGRAPLYIVNRSSGINDASLVLPQADVDYTNAYANSTFYDSLNGGFGGGPPSGDPHMNDDYGQLELTPHNVVHVDVGGWMSDPNTSAQDPIFWLHHSNIDRLWQGWLQSYANPTDTAWLEAPFSFINTSGQQFTITISEFMSTYQPNVAYDELPPAPGGAGSGVAPPAGEQALMATAAGAGGSSGGGRRELAATREPSVQLTGRPATVSLRVPEGVREAVGAAVSAPEGQRIGLQVEGIEFDEAPPGPYYVFVNLPEGEPPDFRSPHYVGNLTFFGHAHAPGAKRSVGTHRFDITPIARNLQQLGLWNPAELSVTFVPGGPVPAPGTEAPAPPPSGELARPRASIRRVTLIGG